LSALLEKLPTLSEIRAELERRRALQLDALTWTEAHRPKIHGQDFVLPEPLRHVYADRSREVVVTKAAQVMVSEWAISLAFWCADTRAGGRGNVLYVFPAIAQLGDFVRARIDTAIEESPYLAERVRPVRGLQPELATAKSADNVGLKRIGNAFIYFRGSNAKAGLISVDADLVVYDEVDRLTEGTLSLGAERLGSSLLGWQRYLSTPTYPEIGIDALWLRSTRNRWMVVCPGCSHEQSLSFPENLREDGAVICAACHAPLAHLGLPGRWIAERPDAELVGYHVSKFLSPRADMRKLARTGYAILRREVTDATKVQEFWNQGLGVPHAPQGGQLSRAEIEACRADYSLGDWVPTGCTMGVDVGAKLHVRVNSERYGGTPRAAFIGSVHGFSDLDGLMRRFDVSRCVVDAEPEHHSARQFASRWPGRVWLCRYPNTSNWPHAEPAVFDDDEQVVSAHRTLTLDAAFARIRERRIELPREVMDVPEYAEQIMAPVRVIEKDARGNPIAKYVEGGKADHFAHAENYAMIAGLAASGAGHRSRSRA
jgi:hypothetical protein